MLLLNIVPIYPFFAVTNFLQLKTYSKLQILQLQIAIAKTSKNQAKKNYKSQGQNHIFKRYLKVI